jgi:hypothetical protein
LGDPAAAIHTLRNAIALSPTTSNLYFQLARIHAAQQQIPLAIQTIQNGLHYAPHDDPAKLFLQKLRSL